jgi:hypothetical protein
LAASRPFAYFRPQQPRFRPGRTAHRRRSPMHELEHVPAAAELEEVIRLARGMLDCLRLGGSHPDTARPRPWRPS